MTDETGNRQLTENELKGVGFLESSDDVLHNSETGIGLAQAHDSHSDKKTEIDSSVDNAMLEARLVEKTAHLERIKAYLQDFGTAEEQKAFQEIQFVQENAINVDLVNFLNGLEDIKKKKYILEQLVKMLTMDNDEGNIIELMINTNAVAAGVEQAHNTFFEELYEKLDDEGKYDNALHVIQSTHIRAELFIAEFADPHQALELEKFWDDRWLKVILQKGEELIRKYRSDGVTERDMFEIELFVRFDLHNIFPSNEATWDLKTKLIQIVKTYRETQGETGHLHDFLREAKMGDPQKKDSQSARFPFLSKIGKKIFK